MTYRQKQIISLIIISIISFSLFSINTALAGGKELANKMISSLGGFTLPGGGERPERVESAVGGILQAFLSIMGIIFLGLMVYGGWKWMLAQGREEELTKAKAIIRSAIIGLGVVLAAYAITYFVVSRFWRAGTAT